MQLGERAAHVAVAADDRLEQRQPELPAEHRGRHQRGRAASGRGGRSARGSPSRPSAGPRPSTAWSNRQPRRRAYERPGVDQRAHELLEEERVALGRLEDPPLDVVRERAGADERVQQLPLRVARERLERELAASGGGASRAALSFTPPRGWSRSGRLVRTSRSAHVLGVARSSRSSSCSEVGVGPVQVLDRDRDRAVLRRGERGARAPPRTCGTAAPRARARRGGRAASGSSVEPEQRREVGEDLVGAVAEQAIDVPAERHAGPGARARRRGRRARSAAGRGTASTACDSP